MLRTVVPEEHHLALRHRLGPVDHQLDYIVEMSTELTLGESTYLLLYGSFRGLMSSRLNQAKYNSAGATL